MRGLYAAAGFFFGLVATAVAQQPNTITSVIVNAPPASLPLAGAELVPIIQGMPSAAALHNIPAGAFSTLTVQGSPVNVRAYGAVCDGSADDTIPIQNAITANASVFIPGNCKITATINLHGKLSVFGAYAGRGVAPYTVLCRTGATDCFSGPVGMVGLTMRNMSIDALGQTAANVLKLDNPVDFLADNVFIGGGFNSVLIQGGNVMSFVNSFIGNGFDGSPITGAYALKWDQQSGGGSGDALSIQNTTIAAQYRPTPAQTADCIVWDGNTKTLTLSNVRILRCNHGVRVRNTRNQADFPQFLFANNMQIEGAVNNAFLAESGSSFWISDSYIKNQGAAAQGLADGPALLLQCDAAQSSNCGGAAGGASVQLLMNNTQVFDAGSQCISSNWRNVQISNSTAQVCSRTTPGASPSVLYGANAGNDVLATSLIIGTGSSYAVQTTVGDSGLTLKDNRLDGATGVVNDLANATDHINRSVQIFIQTTASTTGSASVAGLLKTVNTAVCNQGGGMTGGAFYLTVAGTTINVFQTNVATQPYNCIIGGF